MNSNSNRREGVSNTHTDYQDCFLTQRNMNISETNRTEVVPPLAPGVSYLRRARNRHCVAKVAEPYEMLGLDTESLV